MIALIAGSVFFRILNYQDDCVLYFHTFSVMLDLGIGALMAYTIKTSHKVRTFFENTNGWKHLAFFAFSFLLLYFGDKIFAFKYGSAFVRLFVSISFALIIAAQALTKLPSKLNLGNFKFMSYWGKYTYGIYLLHAIVLTLFDASVRHLNLDKTNFYFSFGMAIVVFGLTLLMSWCSYTWYESRFLKLKDRFTTVQSHE